MKRTTALQDEEKKYFSPGQLWGLWIPDCILELKMLPGAKLVWAVLTTPEIKREVLIDIPRLAFETGSSHHATRRHLAELVRYELIEIKYHRGEAYAVILGHKMFEPVDEEHAATISENRKCG